MGIKHWFTWAALTGLACGSAMAQEQARVLSSIPVAQQVAVPQQVCEDVQVSTGTRTNGTGAVIGAILGGVAGNALGYGGHRGPRGAYYPSTRGPSTVVGAIAGGLIGNAVEGANSQRSYETVRRCTNTTGYENRVMGYDVTYEYAGQRYTTRMDHDPGNWMPINVQPQANYTTSSTTATQFIGPNGVYQTAPSTMVITDNVVYTQPAPVVVGVDIGGGYPPAPPMWHRPPPPHHWR